MSLKKKIVLSLFVSALIIAILSAFLYLNFLEIKKETAFLEMTDSIRSKSLQIRRHEKNYFLYAPAHADEESKAIYQYLSELDDFLNKMRPDVKDRTSSLRLLVNEYRGRFIAIETLVASLSEESRKLEASSPAYRSASGLIEANFLDKPLEDMKYLQEAFAFQPDHRLMKGLREIDAEIIAIRKTGENILIASKDLDKAARDKVDGFIEVSRIAILIFFPLFLVVGFSTMLFIISNVIKRFQLLTDLIERTGTGDFVPVAEPVTAWGTDEVGILIRKFNHMEEQLVLREQELLRSKKLAAIGTLASGVAHELNNPLNNIYTTAQRLMKKTGDDTPPYLRKGLDDIFGQTMRVKSIVSDLLEFARGREPHYRAVELKGLISGVYQHVANTRNMSGIRLHLELVPNEIVLYADTEQLEQIFINLIVNAADAMSGAGDLSIRAVEEEHAVRITISDTGKGMPAATIEKIFEPFFTTKDKGTGLGLAIVFNLIQKHLGTISVESAEEKGTTFIMTLPKKAP